MRAESTYYLLVWLLDDGRAIYVIPLTFARARVCIGGIEDCGFDDGW